MKRKVILPLLLCAAANVNAQTYDTIIGGSTYKHGDYETNISLAGSHYFNGIETKGPLDYFGFNQRNNLLGGHYYYYDNDYRTSHSYGVHGEYNWGDFQFNGSYSRESYEYNYGDFKNEDTRSDISLGVQYFISDNWGIGYGERGLSKVSNSFLSGFNFGDHFYTSYETSITGNDSLGMSLYYLNGHEEFLAGVDYFTPLSSDQFVRVELFFDEDLTVLANAQYYFTTKTYTHLSVVDGEVHGVGLSHFFSDKFRAQFEVSNLNNDGGENVYTAALVGYF